MAAGTRMWATGIRKGGAAGNICSYSASWGALDRKATRCRPVKCIEGRKSSVDGTLQAGEDGGVGLQRKDA